MTQTAISGPAVCVLEVGFPPTHSQPDKCLSLGSPEAHYIDLAGCRLNSRLPECQGSRCEPPCPAFFPPELELETTRSCTHASELCPAYH